MSSRRDVTATGSGELARRIAVHPRTRAGHPVAKREPAGRAAP